MKAPAIMTLAVYVIFNLGTIVAVMWAVWVTGSPWCLLGLACNFSMPAHKKEEDKR